MISAGLSWNDVTKPFYMEPNKAKVNAQYYTNYILKRLIPAWLKMYPDNDYYFMQDGASSYTSKLCQNFLQTILHCRYVNKNEWPPKSTYLNVLDYYFSNEVQECV